MKMPGFNAEESLYKTSKHYKAMNFGAEWNDATQMVQPMAKCGPITCKDGTTCSIDCGDKGCWCGCPMGKGPCTCGCGS